MYYEVYVDILFLKNLWINAILLLMTGWAGQGAIIFSRIMTGAALGSLGACVLTVYSMHLPVIAYYLGTFVLAKGMLYMAYPKAGRQSVSTMALYAECFVLNGFLHYIEAYYALSGIWFVIVCSMAVLVLWAVEGFLYGKKKVREVLYAVRLRLGSSEVHIEGLYDTGNSLMDPFSGQPVSILSESILHQLLEQSGMELIGRKIPYRTISEQGVLEVFVLDSMEIHTGKDVIIRQRPRIACMPAACGQYSLILHRDLLSS